MSEQCKDVVIAIQGEDTTTVGLIASAVNYGLTECGFENVTVAVTDGVTCHPADEHLLPIMQRAKEANDIPFTTEVDIVMVFGDEVDEDGIDDDESGEAVSIDGEESD